MRRNQPQIARWQSIGILQELLENSEGSKSKKFNSAVLQRRHDREARLKAARERQKEESLHKAEKNKIGALATLEQERLDALKSARVSWRLRVVRMLEKTWEFSPKRRHQPS